LWERALEKLNVVGSSSSWKNESGVGWSNLGVVNGVVSGVMGGTVVDCSVISFADKLTAVMASDVIGFFFFFVVVDDLDKLDAASRVSRLTLGTLKRVMPSGQFYYSWLLSGE